MKNFTKLSAILGLFLVSLFINTGHAQNDLLQEMETNYFNFFNLDREALFLHLNKTTLLPEENLWFAAYSYNPKEAKPSSKTVNLKVDIFDDSGKFIETQTIFMSNGKGFGFLELDPQRFQPGNYIMKASTNYMNNFEEDLSYVQAFNILDKNLASKDTTRKSFDLQLLPEGGHLLMEVINTVGVKLIDDSGRGVSFENARILDEAGNVISNFDSNDFGIGKFSYSPLKGKSYKIELTTATGDVLSQQLPSAEGKGISLSSVQRDDDFLVYVRTNKETRKDIEGETFYMTINNDGKMSDFEFQFPENEEKVNILLKKDSLYAGVNTLTIFDSKLNPLLERLIFSDSELKRSRISSTMQNRGDSLIFKLSSEPKLKNASLSVSVLPGKTRAYNQNHNLLSAIYLKPYTKGVVENAAYYFSDDDRREKLHNLDLLLLTQGWSRYDWNSTFKAPQKIVDHDAGFKLQGQILNYKQNKNNKLVVRSQESGLFKVIELKEDGSFELPNTYISEESELSFRLMQGSREIKPVVNLNIIPEDQPSSSRLTNISEYVEPLKSWENSKPLPDDFLSNAETLDTVMVNAERRENSLKKKTINGDITMVTDKMAKRYLNLLDWLPTQNYIVFQTPEMVTIKSPIVSSINTGPPYVLLFLNGVQVGYDANVYRDILMENVESIEINRNGFGMGMNGVNGMINVNIGPAAAPEESRNIYKVVANNGFSTNKEFYAPKYASYQHEIYQNYGIIDWKPAISIDNESQTTFKVLNTGQSSVKLFIEGLSADGSIISEEILLD
ncbi:hypothetical protein MKO06_01495 [Gramella sp. GC03-9]|uniref:TonB-dependent receptor plug domain-containing protein n=1 Tax=Christiangramia oceanisediminis TaxID=2920386 RepID=A0A9X2I8E2_9FLAO|nr:hypothetical protein [Gramella oceanisediminis]MCP9198563.1 hypothetical protein [Gramella oceanisediminis]